MPDAKFLMLTFQNVAPPAGLVQFHPNFMESVVSWIEYRLSFRCSTKYLKMWHFEIMYIQ